MTYLKILVDFLHRREVDWILRSKPSDRKEELLAVLITQYWVLTDDAADDVNELFTGDLHLDVLSRRHVELLVEIAQVVSQLIVSTNETAVVLDHVVVDDPEGVNRLLLLVDHRGPVLDDRNQGIACHVDWRAETRTCLFWS